MTKQTVRSHGGVTIVLRSMWQILVFEGFRGLKRRLISVMESWIASLDLHRVGQGVQSKRAIVGERTSPWHAAIGIRPSIEAIEPGNGLGSIRTVVSPGVLLIGHPYGVLGIGENIRLSAAACAAAQVPFGIRSVYGEHGVHVAEVHKDFPFMDKISRAGAYRTNVFHLNADEMENARKLLGKHLFADRYNIGYWSWELSHFPEAWHPSLQLVDEVWAPSRFIEQAIADKTASPVIRMPLAVEFPEPHGMTREAFGLPEDRFLFLFFFDFTSYVHRKNPHAVIRAFLQAFPDLSDTRVGVVIKMNGMGLRPKEYQAFLESIDGEDSRIILMDKVLTDRETKSLVKLCDCFLSLHRSEGFGRGLAEAMYLGKPVIATGYSGNLDFTNAHNSCLVDYRLIPVREDEYPFGKGQKWADPDIEHAVWFMKRVVNEPHYAQTIGQHAADFIKTHHSSQAVGTKYRRRLVTLNLLDEL
ncbi:glycosyltransferase [Candidatus Nitrospira allomarina]|uniref:Glycosyltransferase n=1 Tax=Candidatus Nitrospira allomarina TaxID=3020900 RepID=A0AA96GK70_9BACT|nr:glycosyltransferase [Candidatus Nitrospira allomarina]WNM59884.1 glycosyltransferase [Candidatus Nitrospira allomarina]